MKSLLFLVTTFCSALVAGGSAFIALVLIRLKGRAATEPEYIILPPTLSETDAERQKEYVSGTSGV